jgi:hypothetical protein
MENLIHCKHALFVCKRLLLGENDGSERPCRLRFRLERRQPRCLSHGRTTLKPCRSIPDTPKPTATTAPWNSSRGNLGAAQADYGSVIRFLAGFGIACASRGCARCMTGDLDGAVADFDRAIRLIPRFTAGNLTISDSRRDLAAKLPSKYKGGEQKFRPRSH